MWWSRSEVELAVVVDAGTRDVDGSAADVVLDSADPVGLQAPSTSSAANAAPTRNGGRVGPPNPNVQRRGLKWLPPFPLARSTLRPFRPEVTGEPRWVMSSR